MDAKYTVERRPLVETEVAPAEARIVGDDLLFVDFGKAAFGTVLVPVPEERESIVVHLGEKLDPGGRIDRDPPGTVRYRRIEQDLSGGKNRVRIAIPSEERNTGPAAIKMPGRIGEVMPFRYAEIEGGEGIDPEGLRQVRVHYPFEENASSFKSSDPTLNAVWDLCKYSIEATSFCGVYVDGDRERIPYEGDAYINQLGHYCVDSEYALARYTHEYLIQHPTWPTEWQLHTVLMAWADYIYSGQTESLEAFYDDLRVKTLTELAREDGLISSESDRCTEELERRLHLHHDRYIFGSGLRDLVDWPPGSFTEGGQGERDGHEMMPVNTVVNALHYRALVLISRIASVLDREEDADRFARRADRIGRTFNRILFDRQRGVYVDGEGSEHASLHSNMFPLAFGLVPEERRDTVVSHVKARGMACSVYGAQYLMEALYRNGEEGYALELLTARHDRSWWHMMEVGSTITLEAWDWKYKNNLDWNHAWGAAPANIIPRFLMGVRPLEPAFRRVLIRPRPGSLESAEMKFPTPRGPVKVRFDNQPEGPFSLEVELPENTAGRVDLPLRDQAGSRVVVDGRPGEGSLGNGFVTVDPVGPGSHTVVGR